MDFLWIQSFHLQIYFYFSISILCAVPSSLWSCAVWDLLNSVELGSQNSSLFSKLRGEIIQFGDISLITAFSIDTLFILRNLPSISSFLRVFTDFLCACTVKHKKFIKNCNYKDGFVCFSSRSFNFCFKYFEAILFNAII